MKGKVQAPVTAMIGSTDAIGFGVNLRLTEHFGDRHTKSDGGTHFDDCWSFEILTRAVEVGLMRGRGGRGSG